MDTRAGDALDTQGLGMGPLVRNSTAKKVVSPHLLIKKNHPCTPAGPEWQAFSLKRPGALQHAAASRRKGVV